MAQQQANLIFLAAEGVAFVLVFPTSNRADQLANRHEKELSTKRLLSGFVAGDCATSALFRGGVSARQPITA